MDHLNNTTMLSGPEWTDVMVDIETGGLSPDRTPILQIAAVKFNLQAGTVCPEFFNKSLTIPPHRFWDQGTAAWWARQKAGVLQNILAQAEPWQAVMHQLYDWLQQTPTLRFWGKPTHFDHSFVASYMKDAELDPNIVMHYRVARDMNTYIEALFYGLLNSEELIDQAWDIPFDGDAHNALADALHQLKILFEAKKLKDATLS